MGAVNRCNGDQHIVSAVDLPKPHAKSAEFEHFIEKNFIFWRFYAEWEGEMALVAIWLLENGENCLFCVILL